METTEVAAGNGLDAGIWLSKDEAAALLGVHTRQVERREAAGQLRKRTLPKEPGQTAARVVYSRADLLALKAGAPNDYRAPGTEVSQKSDMAASHDAIGAVPSTALVRVADSLVGPWLQGISNLLDRAAERAATPAPEPRPWLTLEEAAEYSGLPAAWLLEQAKQGYVGALDLGGRPRGGRWRFRRETLATIGS